MDQGKIIAYGTHSELVKILGEFDRINLTIELDSQKVLKSWQATEGVHTVLSQNGTITLLVDDSNIVLPRLFELATQAGVRIISLEIQEPNLEAVFLHSLEKH